MELHINTNIHKFEKYCIRKVSFLWTWRNYASCRKIKYNAIIVNDKLLFLLYKSKMKRQIFFKLRRKLYLVTFSALIVYGYIHSSHTYIFIWWWCYFAIDISLMNICRIIVTIHLDQCVCCHHLSMIKWYYFWHIYSVSKLNYYPFEAVRLKIIHWCLPKLKEKITYIAHNFALMINVQLLWYLNS